MIVKTVVHNFNFKFDIAYGPTQNSSPELKDKLYNHLTCCRRASVEKHEKVFTLGACLNAPSP